MSFVADVLTPSQRSFCMSRNRGSNTKPEVKLRKALWALGLRYRIKSTLPGRPDIVFPSARLVIFVDGCFWHGCPEHFKSPRTNTEFWETKIRRTQQRDRIAEYALNQLGWRVMRIWEHDVRKCADAFVQEIVAAVRRIDWGT